jgi:hypothetical protein
MTILEEARHTLIIIEHDFMLYGSFSVALLAWNRSVPGGYDQIFK